jgi:hypothetical protein
MEKILNQKNFNNFVWSPLGSRGNIYINFAFKFTFRCQQPDIVPIIFAAGVVDTGGKLPPASLTPAANLPPVSWTPVANLPPVSTTQGELVAKFAAGVVDTGGKFACHRCQQHKGNWWQNLPPVSLIPVANLPPVSLIPAAICHRCR